MIHNLASGTTRELTDRKGYQGMPAWSPDSQTFSVAFKRGEHTGIAVIYASGKRVKQIFDTVALPQHLRGIQTERCWHTVLRKTPQRRLVPLREEAEIGKWAFCDRNTSAYLPPRRPGLSETWSHTNILLRLWDW